jgi:hypothetical protein
MNRRQKSILLNSITVITITVAAVVAMVNFKDWVNRSESIRAMEHLSRIILQYRKSHGCIPPESYIDGIRGRTQFGEINYRARWINFESTPDEVLAYAEKKYGSSLLNDGYVVLRLNGQVAWISKKEFDALLPESEREMEFEMLDREPKLVPPLNRPSDFGFTP